MEEKTCAALVFTVLLLHSFVFLSTAASGRQLLEVEDGMMVLARRMNAENRKDYDPVQANPRHDPSRDPDLNPPTDPRDIPPPQAPEPAPPVDTDPPHQTAPTADTDHRSSIYHHVHHQRHPSATQIRTPINDPAPPPIPTTTNHGV